MLLGSFTKRPSERKRYNVDYSIWLDDDEVLDEVTFEVTPATDPAFSVDEYHIANDRIVIFYVSGGEPTTTYEVVLTAKTSKGDIEVNSVSYSVTR